MNAANEILVSRFLDKKISWLDIGRKLESLMQDHQLLSQPGLEEILAIDQEARREAALV